MINKLPWDEITSSISDVSLNGILADKDNLLEYYWAKDIMNNLVFILHTTSEIILNKKLPTLHGIKVSLSSFGDKNQLLLSLISKEDKDVFYTLCMDLMKYTTNIENEASAVKIIIYRLEKWQYFLKNNRKIIDKRQLKGLIGELIFLNKFLLNNYDVENALTFWKAPLQSVQDFEMNNMAIEVKTKSSVNSVTISSHEQLYCELEYLLLYVVTLSESTKQTLKAFNIYDLINEIREKIKENDIMLISTFDNLLMSYGFIELEEYKEHYYLYITDEFYKIVNGFPRIGSIPHGIESLTYRINLETCKEYLINEQFLKKVGISNE